MNVEAQEDSCEDFILVEWDFLNKASISGYNVWRRLRFAGGSYEKLNDELIDPNTTEYEDFTAVADNIAAYDYIVRAVNECNDSSADSNVAMGNRVGPTSAPTSVTASADGTNQINITWEIGSNPNICLLYTSPSPRD